MRAPPSESCAGPTPALRDRSADRVVVVRHAPSLHPYWVEVLRRIGVRPVATDAAPASDAAPEIAFAPDRTWPDAAALRTRAAVLTPFHGGAITAHEVVAGVDHAALRRRVERTLADACARAGVPFTRHAHAPRGFAAAFVVRIDADGFDAHATDTLLARLADARLRATWFIDVERHLRAGAGAHVRRIADAGHDVQSHAFRHYTYRSYGRNRDNLQRSLDVLRSFGVEATAAAAPFGSWNESYARAARDLGLRWTSEFSRSYDDVPGVHLLADGRTSEWQLPTHPICPALLARAGASEADVVAWFVTRLRAAVARGEPFVCYSHPIGDLQEQPRLLGALRTELDACAEAGAPVWQPTMSELHAFAVLRRSATFADADDDATLAIRRDAVEPTIELARPDRPTSVRARLRLRAATATLQGRRWWREIRLPAAGKR